MNLRRRVINQTPADWRVLGAVVFIAAALTRGEEKAPDAPANAAGPAPCKTFVGPDADQDCDVDLRDYHLLQACVTGPDAGPPAFGCEAWDADTDNDVDPSDAFVFVQCRSGPAFPAEPGCEAPGFVPPTALDRIDEELAAGLISETDALRYKVFNVFGDDRLPPRFYGATYEEGSDVVLALSEQMETLPPEAQEELAPFLLPPDAPGSWFALQLASDSNSTTRGDVPDVPMSEIDVLDGGGASVAVVKWPQTMAYLQPTAKTVAAAMAGPNGVYEQLVSLMGRAPMSDAALDPDVNGGDGRYDVYVLPMILSDIYGVTRYHSTVAVNDSRRPAFTVVNAWTIAGDYGFESAAYNKKLRSNVSHELMHAIQHAFNASVPRHEYKWIREATATWAENFVFPDDEVEHEDAGSFLRRLEMPLETVVGNRHYGAYLYFFHHVNTYTDDEIVRRVFENLESFDPLDAIDLALTRGISRDWPLFAVANWNDWHNDNLNFYEDADLLKKGAVDYTIPEIALLSGQQQEIEIALKDDELQPLSMQYFHYKFSDPDVRSILFANGLTFDLKRGVPSILAGTTGDETLYAEVLPDSATEHVSVLASIKQNGAWVFPPFVMSNTAFAPFCQEASTESIEEIVLIMANGRFEGGQRDPISPKGLSSRFFISNQGCGAWEGDAVNIYEVTNADETTSSTTTVKSIEIVRDTYTLNDIAGGQGDFAYGSDPGSEIVPIGSFADFLPYGGSYELGGISGNWSHITTYDTGFLLCSGLGSGTIDPGEVSDLIFRTSPFLTGSLGNENPSYYRSFRMDMYVIDLNSLVAVDCIDDNGNDSTSEDFFSAVFTTGFDENGFIRLPIDPSGNTINQSWWFGDDYVEVHLQSQNIP